MCAHGDTVTVRVWIAADLSATGQETYKDAEIDRCIAPIVLALSKATIHMRSSCCGHGKGPGEILLEDGRRLVIRSASNEATVEGNVPASDRLDTAPHAQGVSAPLLSAAMKPNEPTPGFTTEAVARLKALHAWIGQRAVRQQMLTDIDTLVEELDGRRNLVGKQTAKWAVACSALERAEDMLRQLEWSATPDRTPSSLCPVCRAIKDLGHNKVCALAGLLAGSIL